MSKDTHHGYVICDQNRTWVLQLLLNKWAKRVDTGVEAHCAM